MQRIYMDANATTPLSEEVFAAMRPYWMEAFANASSIHQDGQRAHRAVTEARESVAALLGCREAEVVFNSGGTEGDNTALFGLLRPGDHLITSSIEHSAVLQAAERMQQKGVEVSFVDPLPSGVIAAEAIRAVLRPNTRLISVMLANNETGVLQPVEAIGQIAAEAGVFFHIDAVQGAGKVELNVERFGCHLLSISAHKMHGPKGVGVLFVRRGTPLEAQMLGGSHERRRRAGTENVPGIVGLGKAAELARKALTDGTQQRVAALRDRLEAGMLALEGSRINPAQSEPAQSEPAQSESEPVARVSNTTNVLFEGVESEALLIALDMKGIAASGGSACHSGSTKPSHVLLAMGLNEQAARSSLRFSLLKTATEADVDRVLEVLPEAVRQLRALSTTAKA
jgi:cysteine desulfurase